MKKTGCMIGTLLVAMASSGGVHSETRYENEWNFELDAKGGALSAALNSGEAMPSARFDDGFSRTVYTTNLPSAGNSLICIGQDETPDQSGAWTSGALLGAELEDGYREGVHYLRYDVEYDFSSSDNRSGSVLGVYFSEGSGAQVAGMVFGDDRGALTSQAAAQGRSLTQVTAGIPLEGIAWKGIFTVIAELDLNQTPASLQVWYGLGGLTQPPYEEPAHSGTVDLNSLDELRFHATGDFRPNGTADYAAVETIRHTTGMVPGGRAWEEITEPLQDRTRLPELHLSMVDLKSGAMEPGQTNVITVEVHNKQGGRKSGPALNVQTAIRHDGSAAAFTIVSNNVPAPIVRGGETLVHSYEVTAHERGIFQFEATARSEEIEPDPETLTLRVGRNLDFLPLTADDIEEVEGGVYRGLYEPGETLHLTLSTTNNSALTVSNVQNELIAPVGFSVRALGSQTYDAIEPGSVTSTVYEVIIAKETTPGVYTFQGVNTDGEITWTGLFDLDVSTRVPGMEWVKADNEVDLNRPESWVRTQVPDASDLAILDDTVTEAIETALGGDLSWRGLVLASNSAPWTITGPHRLSIGAAGIDLSDAQADLTVEANMELTTSQEWNVPEARVVSLSGMLAGGSSASLLHAGGGALVMTNANSTFTGGLTVSNSTLHVANRSTTHRGPLGVGPIMLEDTTLRTDAEAMLANPLYLSKQTDILNDHRLTLAGSISGSGHLRKTGSGLLVLGGENTFSGGVYNEGAIEVQSTHALGKGTVTLKNGSSIRSAPYRFTTAQAGLPNALVLDGNVVIRTGDESWTDVFRVDGPISGAGRLTLSGGQFWLFGKNSFSGGLDIALMNWLRFAGPDSMGSGEIRSVAGTTRRMQVENGGVIRNSFVLDSTLRFHMGWDHEVEIAGSIQGGGALDITDGRGRLVLSGENAEWTGGINALKGDKTLRVAHSSALGTGPVFIGNGPGTARMEFTASGLFQNNLRVGPAFSTSSGLGVPIELKIDQDAIFTGTISDWDPLAVNWKGVIKTGSGAMTIEGDCTISGPFRVGEGVLEVNGSMQNELTMSSGTTLKGRGWMGNTVLRGGSNLILNQSERMTFAGDVVADEGSLIVLSIEDADTNARIEGGGGQWLFLAGTLRLDFSQSSLQPGDRIILFPGWSQRVDGGVSIEVRGLDGSLQIDPDRLFTEGEITMKAQDPPPPPPVKPGDRVKADNTLALNDPLSWIGGSVPGMEHRAVLDNRAFRDMTTPMGGDLHWRGIALVSNTVDWVITGLGTLAIGSAGVDLSEAGADFRVESRLALPVSQTWNVSGGRIAQVAGQLDVPATVGWVKTGEGVLGFSGDHSRSFSGTLIVSNGAVAVSGGYNRLDDLRVEVTDPPLGTGLLQFAGGTGLGTLDRAAGLMNPITILDGLLRVEPGQDIMLAGSIGGAGGLLHFGPGTLRLGGKNTFSGGTVVNSGSTVEFVRSLAFGQGPVTLHEGAALNGWLPAEDLETDRIVQNKMILEGSAILRNLADVNTHEIRFTGPITGSGGLRVELSTGWRDIYLLGRNTFEGDLTLYKTGGDAVLRGASPSSLGRGTIISLSDGALLGLENTGGRIENRINLNSGTLNFLPAWHSTVELAGEIYGTGSISFVNRTGTIRLSGDNRNWSGGIAGIGTYNNRDQTKRVIVDHPNALGTGQIVIGGHERRVNFIQIYVRSSVETGNDLFAAHSGPEKIRNDLLVISQNSIFGRLDGVAAHQGLDKTGPGRMTLTAQGNYPSPFNVREGVLELDSAGFPGRTTVSPGAGLIADNARTGSVRIRSGARIEVKGNGLRVENGALTLDGDSKMVLRPGDPATALLTGDGARDLSLSGTLLVDFSQINPAPTAGDSVELFGNWSRMLNNDVTVLAAGLDDFMTIDTSTLFTDGRVRVIDGGRLSSQDLEIRVTSGGTGSASVEVHNPENVTRFFHLKPGAEWPSWLSAAPTSARSAVGPGAQATVSASANATGLPAGTHRFMLPVVWEHGVTDFIQITVQVEGPSLTVAPGLLPLTLVENTTGEGTVDLVNTGTLPVSYRVRRVLAEDEVYTQPAADVSWITVSPTAQTRITSFPGDRSAPRAIGFDFPFFGATETEVSVGIDGTLWFGGKPAIRVFSNQLSYLSGTSKVTAKPEADRFIVTWNRMIQPDNAQQTFQAVLHRDGRIDLRYETIVGNSAWQNALIGLYGPTQWFPAQVPETLQGRTIRFARDADTARISIPQISGTVAAGATQTLGVMADATGLSADESRTASFAIDYDGGLAGTAGEVQVTMEVVAAAGDPVGDGLAEDLSPPFYPRGPDPVVVLNPPRRTADGGRHLSWSLSSDDGASGYQTYGTEGQYRVQWTTNLASGIWANRTTVTNEFEYTDEEEMPGSAIFYRIIKEK